MADTPAEVPPDGEVGTVASPVVSAPVAAKVAETPWLVILWSRIKEHKIVQWTVAYAAFAFVALHAATLLSDAFEWPHGIVRALALVLTIGLPMAPILAWYHGVRALRRVSIPELILIVLLLVIAGALLWRSPHSTAEQARGETASPAVTQSAKSESTEPVFAPPAHSIAVLPFADMSEKKDQEYFSDGMAEEIIDLLVRIPELKVPARTSSFYFKGKATQIPEIARELGVANVLEGSVRKSGTHLRVTAQLVRADSGFHLWSETYDRQLDDVFKVQDEIAGAVVNALKVSLLGGQAPNAAPTTSTEAYELYLQARSLLNRQTVDDALKAYADLQQAVTLDPKFALAWAALADVLSNDIYNVDWNQAYKHNNSMPQQGAANPRDWGTIWSQTRAAARAAAERAVKEGPGLGESHAAMGKVLAWVDWDWQGADAELKHARELEPGNADITLAAARVTFSLGRTSEGLQLAKRAAVQDPLGPAFWWLAWMQYCSGSLDEATDTSLRAIELDPTAVGYHYYYALVLLARGQSEAALSEFERENSANWREVGPPLALDALGRHSDADQAIAIAEQKNANAMAYQIAYIYASRKDFDRTFYWLERAYQQHDGGVTDLKVDPMFKTLQHDPRYKALLHKMNLPE